MRNCSSAGPPTALLLHSTVSEGASGVSTLPSQLSLVDRPSQLADSPAPLSGSVSTTGKLGCGTLRNCSSRGRRQRSYCIPHFRGRQWRSTPPSTFTAGSSSPVTHLHRSPGSVSTTGSLERAPCGISAPGAADSAPTWIPPFQRAPVAFVRRPPRLPRAQARRLPILHPPIASAQLPLLVAWSMHPAEFQLPEPPTVLHLDSTSPRAPVALVRRPRRLPRAQARRLPISHPPIASAQLPLLVAWSMQPAEFQLPESPTVLRLGSTLRGAPVALRRRPPSPPAVSGPQPSSDISAPKSPPLSQHPLPVQRERSRPSHASPLLRTRPRARAAAPRPGSRPRPPAPSPTGSCPRLDPSRLWGFTP